MVEIVAHTFESLDKKNEAGYSDAAAKFAILDAGRRMYSRGWAAANDGNISCMTAGGEIWVTPGGVSKGHMKKNMLVKVDVDGAVLEGDWKPSSEILMHLRVYKENCRAKAVVHAHTPMATAFACAGMGLDKPILAEVVALLGPVPVAPFALPGTGQVAEAIAPFCRDYCSVLLANHGVLTWGASLSEAYHRLERLEHYAHVMMLTGHLPGTANYIGASDVAKLSGAMAGGWCGVGGFGAVCAGSGGAGSNSY